MDTRLAYIYDSCHLGCDSYQGLGTYLDVKGLRRTGVTDRCYRVRDGAKLEPLCNRYTLNHCYASLPLLDSVCFSTAHRQQVLLALYGLYTYFMGDTYPAYILAL